MKGKKLSFFVFIVVTICFTVMAISYASLASQVTIKGTSGYGDANWNISFLSIKKNEVLSTKDSKELSLPETVGTFATFNVELSQPGSRIIYDIVVQNTGTIDASLDTITGINEVNNEEPKNIIYKIDQLNYENGSIATTQLDLPNKTGKNYFRVTVEWPITDINKPISNASKAGTIFLNYKQK